MLGFCGSSTGDNKEYGSKEVRGQIRLLGARHGVCTKAFSLPSFLNNPSPNCISGLFAEKKAGEVSIGDQGEFVSSPSQNSGILKSIDV
ncbi:unnamed protein product [Rodentolepis nana]|uniref:Uncharacterized protein n=1 Tax=Rodentolepis nana TaxID=102285 RepID=A0A0R3TCB8_RODNA|nr:unnamed protein product [Rodentolepis nana]